MGIGMNTDFSDLKKIPRQPAAKLLSLANARLGAKIKAPPSAGVDVVLEELAEADKTFDILRLLSVALPARERAWWACLAARDIVGADTKKLPAPLAAAETWVFKPTDENREIARKTLDVAEVDDDTTLCATIVAMCDGTLGPGELSKFPAPPGGTESAAYGMNLISLGEHSENFEAHCKLLIDRALDIARGGNGRLDQDAKADAPELDKE